MIYTQDISRALPGAKANDDARALMRKLEEAARESVGKLRDSFKGTPKPFMKLVNETADIDAFEPLAKNIRANFKDLVLVGTGGSSLGAKALCVLSEGRKDVPTLHILENVDPHTTQSVLDAIDPAKTFCLLVSKSGNTVEVMSNAHVLLAHFEKTLGKAAIKNHFAAITEPKSSPLKEVATHYGMPTLDHDPEVGGRYSVFSLVGLLPALALGIDVRAFRKGAADVLAHTLTTEDISQNYPAIGAALQTYHMHQGRQIHVFMPYCDRLMTLSYWYRQLVAESLGKEHTGVTPLASFGAVDQHSMLQLYNDGPADKQYTFIVLDQAGQGPKITPVEGVTSLPHVMNRTIGDMMMAMQHGTINSVANQHQPVRIITPKTIDAATMGALMMHWSLETVISGDLMEVDPYNQPAVEESKRLAREYLDKAA